MNYYDVSTDLVADYTPALKTEGELTNEAATALGLRAGIPVSYRAGDQPNNAMSLGVLEPGEIAATGGTSGVVYGVIDKKMGDPQSRVNSFAHVNYTHDLTRVGVLLCINGAGIQYSWIKKQLVSEGISYTDMERMMSSVPVNSDGLRIIPFGNGSERMLGNINLGSHVVNLHFNRHTKAHYYRAALEGVAYSFVYGVQMMKELGINVDIIKVGNDNLFQSSVFANTVCALVDAEIQVIETTGAVGAAKAAGISSGIYSNLNEAFNDQHIVTQYDRPASDLIYKEGYHHWVSDLEKIINNHKS